VNTAALGFGAGESLSSGLVAEEFRSRTGIIPPSGSVLQLGIARIKNQNLELPYPAVPGALGTTLRESGLTTAVLGNADVTQDLRRQAVSIAMDEDGLVDMGRVDGRLLIKHDGFPGGLHTDYATLVRELHGISGQASFLVIDVGDLSRLEEYREDILDSILYDKRKAILQEIDRFLGEVMKVTDFEKDMLLIVSPTRSRIWSPKDNSLTPVLAAGKGLSKGILLSPGTKRQGLIVNIDLAPTVLRHFNLPLPTYMMGQPVQAVEKDNQLDVLFSMHKNIQIIYHARPILLKGYIIYQLGVLLAGVYYIFRRRDQANLILKPFLLSIMAVPLAFLILPLVPKTSFAALTLELFFITLLLTIFALFLEKKSHLGPFIFLSFVTASLIVADILTGSNLQINSILGYDPIIGARFYGIGNEYEGVLIGSLIIGCTGLLSYFHRFYKTGLLVTGGIFLFVIFVLGNPRLGSDLGGVIAASSAFIATFLLLQGLKFNLKKAFYLVMGVVCLVVFLLIIDMRRPPEIQTHFGRNATIILSGGWQAAIDIIERKLAMNIKLIKYTIWSRIFLASLGSLALLFYRPVGVMAAIRNSYPVLYKGFMGVVVGSIAALIFNDSGIVAAATTIIYGAPPLIYLVLQEQTGKKFI